jgi:hypothetical protein
MESLNEALIRVYASLDCSVDRLASAAILRQDFRSRLAEEFRPLDDDELVHRLLNLRKRGKLARSHR